MLVNERNVKNQSLLPLYFPALYKKKHTPLFYRYSDFLFIPTNFQMSEADMENGDDLQILSAEFF